MKQRSIGYRLAALDAEIERRKAIQEMPVDPLSQSLEEYYRDIASLDELGKAALLEELNRENPLDGKQSLQLTPEAVDQMVETAHKEVALTSRTKLIQ